MEKQFECLLIEKSNGVATITLNRPDVFNAFNDTISYEMQEALNASWRDLESRISSNQAQRKEQFVGRINKSSKSLFAFLRK